MSWICEFSADAEKDLQDLSRAIQERVARVMTRLSIDPFQGNVIALQGDDWKGVFRRRIGDYRLLFKAAYETNSVIVVRILLRSGKTYR